MDITNDDDSGRPAMETGRFGVAGMTCDKCVARVEKALRSVNGVRDVKVDRRAATATVTFERDKTDMPALQNTVLKAGYTPSAMPPS